MKNIFFTLLTCIASFSLSFAQEGAVGAPICSSTLPIELRTGYKFTNPDHSPSDKARVSVTSEGHLQIKAVANFTDSDLQWLKLRPFTGTPNAKILKIAVRYSVLPSPNNSAANCYISQTRLLRNTGENTGLVIVDDGENLVGVNKTHITNVQQTCGSENKTIMFRLAMSVGDIIKIHQVIVYFECPTNPCNVQSATPIIVYAGKELYNVEDKKFIRYKIPVTNVNAIANALFAPAPTLPPCGSNANSSRTWVDIYNENGQRVYGFCALGSSANLKDIWFGLRSNENPPKRVMIKMTDRLCNKVYASNWISIQ